MKVDFGLELAKVDSTDMDKLRAWRNDHRIWQWARQSDLISDVEQEAWFRRQSDDPTIRMYKVLRRVDGHRETVGVAGLTSIDMHNRRAEFSLLIGPEHQGKGYGREALSILLRHAFLNVGLLQVWGESFSANPAMAMFDKLGMKRDGIRRGFYFKDGAYVDAHLFSILRDEWLISTQQASSSSQPHPSSATPSLSMSSRGTPEGTAAAVSSPQAAEGQRRGGGRRKSGGNPLQLATSGPGSSSRRRGIEDVMADGGVAGGMRCDAQVEALIAGSGSGGEAPG